MQFSYARLFGFVRLLSSPEIPQQDSLLYFPTIGGVPRHPSQNPRRYRSPSEHNVPFQTHMIKCEDGVSIHSWLLYHPSSSTNKGIPTIIFFHGNAGNIGLRLPNAIQMYHYLQANVWLVEYRGYGDSDDAVINEKGLKLDAEAVLRYVHDASNNMSNVDVKKLFVFGRSLGGAVAFHLAKYAHLSNYPSLAGVLVENTFVSISDMVDHLMPYVAPLKSLVLRIGWNSGEIVPTINTPTMFLAGAQDTLVPHSHMLELYSRMKNSKTNNIVRMHVVKNGTHNETWMQGGKDYWVAIKRFLNDVLSAEAPDGRVVRNANGVFQRKTSTSTTFCSTDASSYESVNNESIEVSMGSNDDGEDAAEMISSVGNFMGMAREATRSVAAGRGHPSATKKKG